MFSITACLLINKGFWVSLDCKSLYYRLLRHVCSGWRFFSRSFPQSPALHNLPVFFDFCRAAWIVAASSACAASFNVRKKAALVADSPPLFFYRLKQHANARLPIF
jgi:hypothetical protein